jgi:molybdopterin-guanine dinucleotide biosynthesis protein
MPVVSISGHSRKVGKTSIVEGLIAALPEYNWTALKVSSHLHSCDSSKDYEVIEETGRDGGNDTSRFLKAGARRAFWIQAEKIESAIPAVREIIYEAAGNAAYVVIEGNSVLDFIADDFSILVINCRVVEFKKSARDILSRADALVIIHKNADIPEWGKLLESSSKNTPRFETGDPKTFPPALAELLRSRFPVQH